MSDRDWGEIVGRLRAKAASTQFPEEAAALTARADHLAEKYGVKAGLGESVFGEQQRIAEEWWAGHNSAAARARAWGNVQGAGSVTTSESADGFVITFTFG